MSGIYIAALLTTALVLAIGLGFGIGEIWFIAHRIAQNPSFAGIPFYQFGGFMGERCPNCRHWHMIDFRTDVPDEDASPASPSTDASDFTKHGPVG